MIFYFPIVLVVALESFPFFFFIYSRHYSVIHCLEMHKYRPFVSIVVEFLFVSFFSGYFYRYD